MLGEPVRPVVIEHVRGWRIINVEQGRWYAANMEHGSVLGFFDSWQQALTATNAFDWQHGLSGGGRT